MKDLEVYVSNVGGIDEYETTFQPGTSIISGMNASSKTSLLRAMAFAMGDDDVPIRSSADRAEVTLSVDGRTATRTATRHGAATSISGDPWIRDEELRRKFSTVAALLEFNTLRSAVRRRDGIEEALKSPIDFDRLERERSDLIEERRTVEQEVERLADVEERLDRRERELVDARERREELEAELAELRDSHEQRSEDEKLAELRDQRTELRTEKERTKERIESTESAIDRYEVEQEELTDDITELEARLKDADVDRLETERDRLETKLREIRERIDILQSVMTANQEMLNSEFTGELGKEHGLSNDEVICWTCGSWTQTDDIEATIAELRELVKQDKRRKRERQPEIDELTDKIEVLEADRAEMRELRAERSRISEKLEDRTASLERHRDRLKKIESEFENVSSELQSREQEQANEASETAEAIEERHVRIQSLKREIDRLTDECENLREKRKQREQKQQRVEEIGAEIEEITGRIEGMESRLRDQFNDAMEELLSTLAFEGIERIRLDGSFSLVVAREMEETIHRDTSDNLAESERELVGLVLGLAGYLAYDLAEEVPVLLLDSLGAIDNERVEQLIEYFGGTAEFLIAAVTPDTSEAIGTEGITVSQAPAMD